MWRESPRWVAGCAYGQFEAERHDEPVSAGSQQPSVIVGFFTAATLGWAWVTAVFIHLIAQFRRSDESLRPD
jgi:hypothetical protein